MTETPPGTSASSSSGSGRRKAGLEGMLLPELKQVASGLGLKVTGMRKGQIVEAIKASQGSARGSAPTRGDQPQEPVQGAASSREEPTEQPRDARRGGAAEQAGAPARQDTPKRERDQAAERGRNEQPAGAGRGDKGQDRPQDRQPQQPERQGKKQSGPEESRTDGREDSSQNGRQSGRQNGPQDSGERPDKGGQDRQQQDRQQQDRQQQDRQQQDEDDQGGSRRNRRRRGRDRANQGNSPAPQSDRGPQGGSQGDRDRGHQGQSGGRGGREPDLQILEDDVLTPCAGILDLMDNYAFVRTSGYLPGADDVYVSMSMVRKHGLRRGDAVAGQVRQPREGERKEKFNPLVRIDSVNGADPDSARSRVEFAKLTPIHPSERLRLENGPGDLVGRVVDLAAPVGKGQRGLVVSPPRAGKTTVLQSMAGAVTTNHPECHLMVVLLDERPEEVTDFERSVKGEVIASTFDRPPSDHTVVAELALERAMRLVELGLDVVVLLDGLTRLGRAYNLASTSSGRALPGGVDVASLHPPKQFFGAARNVENGGSLTIIGTATVESGSRVDEVIFEELEGTANMELRLRGELADQRLFPAIDVVRSSTRREDLLLGEQEQAIVAKLRRLLAPLGHREAHELVLTRLRESATNLELLRRVQQAPGAREK